MKKFLLVAILVLALPLVTAGVALADNGPHYGGTTTPTEVCDACHQDNTPPGSETLIDTVPDLCLTCHGSTGSGADTNVEDGTYLERDSVTEVPLEGINSRGLKGGGFVNALMDKDLGGVASTMAATSSHIADGSTGTSWGNGAIGSGAGATGFSLSCTSCHDPHGNSNYRTLRPTPINSGAPVGVNVPDEIVKNYTVTSASGQYFGEGYNLVSPSTSPMSVQYVALSDWCIQCHTRYLVPPDGATTDSGDAIFAYRHMTGDTFNAGGDCSKCHGNPFVTPPPITFNGTYWNHDVECMTCHVAHGCSASMSGYAGFVEWPDGAITPAGNARSSLLRVDNRGTCQLCHADPHTPTNDACAECHRVHTADLPKLLPFNWKKEADLSVSKSDSPDPVTVGSNLIYTLTAENDGPDTAVSVEVIDNLPVSVMYVSNNCGADPPAGNVLTWNVGNLDDGASAVCNITVIPILPISPISNQATVLSSTTDPNTGNNTVTESTTILPDSDGDGIPDGDDNCPGTPNPDQKNNDGDADGDECDLDDDNDGILDDDDACPFEDATGQDADDDGCIDVIEDLPQVVEDLTLPTGTENSLKAKIKNIQKSIDAGNIKTAINQLNAFINQVKALRGKKIDAADADMLIQYAMNLINSLLSP